MEWFKLLGEQQIKSDSDKSHLWKSLFDGAFLAKLHLSC